MKNLMKLEYIAKKNGYINMVDMLSEYGMFPIFRKVLKKEIDTKKIDRIAIKNCYNDTWGMLIECDMVPSVQKPYKNWCHNKPKFKILLLKDFIECMRKRP